MSDVAIIRETGRQRRSDGASGDARKPYLLISRHISPNEVLQALSNGRIIEDYPSDYPFPSCLVFGCTVQNRKLHIVCSIVNDDILTIITAYEPDFNKWNKTFTKRRDT